MKIVFALIALLATFASAQEAPKPAATQPPTEISADLGTCRVDFKVTNLKGKPIYNAKIKTTIRYGFLGKRKLSLEAATNSDGRLRFVKMPNQVRDPVEFEATYGDDTTTVVWDPGNDCSAEYPVMLGKKPEQQ